MPKPIPVAMRRQIVERRQQGERLKRIAEDLSMPYESVRKVWGLYRREGRIEPNYETCGQRGVKASPRVYRAALWLKRNHPTWGAPLIRQIIRDQWVDEKVPHLRTLQRWFRRAGLPPKKPKGEGQARRGRGTAPHNIWEMDSPEAIQLATGEQVSWLLVSDEASGAVLDGKVFSPRPRQPDHGA
ncbi:MAG: hypothetical protein L0154_12675 [Chloroflexi bacterium]|nr:hypothetical protein [Chloroflexota bacterium]